MKLEFFYELASPYSYLASTQLDALAQRTGAQLRLVPITLGGLRKTIGAQGMPAIHLTHLAQDLPRWAKRYAVPLRMPDALWTNTILPLRACVAAERLGAEQGRAAMHALFRGYWADNQDIAQAPLVEALLAKAGLDGHALVAQTQDPVVKDGLKANTQEAFERAVYGTPTIFVGEQMFFGNDRLDFVEEALRAEAHG